MSVNGQMSNMRHTLSALGSCTVLFFTLFLSSCESHYSPKPRGYFRIGLPEKSYTIYNNGCPFQFDYPEYAFLEKNTSYDSQDCWMDVVYPEFNARLHLSYFPVHSPDELMILLEDAHTFAFSHAVRASAIDQTRIDRPEADVYGLWYHIKGNVASNLQFFVTDSTTHYLRGALYFNESPRIDSIQPVLEFLRADMEYMVNTFHWK